ncbi:hypothetical protein MTR67_013026, partial [Solanum verrucosum]
GLICFLTVSAISAIRSVCTNRCTVTVTLDINHLFFHCEVTNEGWKILISSRGS